MKRAGISLQRIDRYLPRQDPIPQIPRLGPLPTVYVSERGGTHRDAPTQLSD